MTESPSRPATPGGSASDGPHEAPLSVSAPRESWRSEELLGDRTEVLIQHGSEVYRLRRTKQGKLILYK